MGIVGFQNYPITDQGRAWNGAQAHARALAYVSDKDPTEWTSEDWIQFRGLHLWYDSSASEDLGSYKFQVADIVDGAPHYVFRAASAALAVLRGGRGADSSAAWWDDRAGMESVVAKIYKKFDQDFPEASKMLARRQQRKSFPLEIKTLNEDGRFEGFASVYGTRDLVDDIVLPGAFTKSIAERGDEVPLLWGHDELQPVGTGLLTDSPKGLKIAGQLDMEDAVALDVYRRLKKKIVKGLSIGYQAMRSTYKDGVRSLSEVKLLEVSLVVIPANEQALVTSVKQIREAIERKDFNGELAEAQLCAARYQMIYALDSAIGDIIWGSDEENPDPALEAIEETIQQFHDEIMAWAPKYLAFVGAMYKSGSRTAELKAVVMQRKEGRRFSGESKDALTEARDHAMKCVKSLEALLLDDEAGGDSATSPTKGAAAELEPAIDHSKLPAIEAFERLVGITS